MSARPDDASGPPDAAILAELERFRDGASGRFRSYGIRDLRLSAGRIDLEVFHLERDDRARLRLDLPSSGAPQHWLYSAPPVDAADWVSQLLIWLDEEVDTGGLGSWAERETVDGESYVMPFAWGFVSADPERRDRLARESTPFSEGPPTRPRADD